MEDRRGVHVWRITFGGVTIRHKVTLVIWKLITRSSVNMGVGRQQSPRDTQPAGVGMSRGEERGRTQVILRRELTDCSGEGGGGACV